MKRIKIITVFVFFTLFYLVSCNIAEDINVEETISYKNPVSVTYSENTNLYYISNRGSSKILTRNNREEINIFIEENLNGPNGIIILNNILYVANSLSPIIKGFDLISKQEVFSMNLHGQYLNYITSKNNNTLFVSDTHKGTIFKINLDTNSYSQFLKRPIINPTGLVYNKQKNVLLCCAGEKNNVILKIDGSSGEIIKQKKLPFVELDGIAFDKFNNIYFSCWSLGKVYKINFEMNIDPIEIASGYEGAAGLYINNEDNMLVVCSFDTSTVDFINIDIIPTIIRNK